MQPSPLCKEAFDNVEISADRFLLIHHFIDFEGKPQKVFELIVLIKSHILYFELMENIVVGQTLCEE